MSNFKFKLGEIVKIKDDAIFHWHGETVIITECLSSISYDDYLEGATDCRYEDTYHVVLNDGKTRDCYPIGESDIERLEGKSIIIDDAE